MANEVTFVIKGRDQSRAALDSARKAMRGFGVDIKATAQAAADLDDKLDSTVRKIGTLGGERTVRVNLVTVSRGIDNIGDSTERTRQTVRRLGDDFDVTKRKGTSLVTDTGGPLAAMAVKLSGSLAGAVTTAFSGLAANPIILGAAAVAGTALALALAAPIGGILTAGILTAIGGGVLAAGIVAAMKSSRVDELLHGKTELQGSGFGRQGTHRSPALEAARTTRGLLDDIKDAFANFGASFERPVVDAIKTFSAALIRMAPTINLLGATLAPIIDKLAPALAAIAERALPGIAAAAEASLPLFEVLADHGPAIGDAVGRFAQALADAAPYAAAILDDFLQLVEFVLPKLGKSLGTLAMLYDINTAGGKKLAGMIDPLLGKLDVALEKSKELLRRLALFEGRSISSAITSEGLGARQGSSGRGKFMASGGVSGGGWTTMHERGAEAVRLPSGATVIPAGQTAQMVAGGGSRTGATQVLVGVVPGAEGVLAAALMPFLRFEVRQNGGVEQAFA